MDPRTLSVNACAAGGLPELRRALVEPLLGRGWRVTVTLTPTAATWLAASGEVERLAELTGYPVRHLPRLPTDPRPHPQPDCVVVAPATANTIAKLALGIADNQLLTQTNEAIGTPGVPVVVAPSINRTHTHHPAWPGHVETLRRASVVLVLPPSPRPDPRAENPLPWPAILEAVETATRSSTSSRGGRCRFPP